MTLDGFETLALVKRYLASEVIPLLPEHVATEVRASLKLLDNAANEFALSPAMLPREIAELQMLGRGSMILLAADPRGEAAAKIPDPDIFHAEAGDLSNDVRDLLALRLRLGNHLAILVPSLQDLAAIGGDGIAEGAKSLLVRIYHVMSRQARERMTFQSVFPTVVAFSESGIPGPA